MPKKFTLTSIDYSTLMTCIFKLLSGRTCIQFYSSILIQIAPNKSKILVTEYLHRSSLTNLLFSNTFTKQKHLSFPSSYILMLLQSIKKEKTPLGICLLDLQETTLYTCSSQTWLSLSPGSLFNNTCALTSPHTN